VITLGDALGFIGGHAQPTKLAAMEGLWKTEEPPAAFNVIAIPNERAMRNDYELQIPYLLTPLVTRTLDTVIPGADTLMEKAKGRIASGIVAVAALRRLQEEPGDADALARFEAHEKDLGYGFLVGAYAPDQDPTKADAAAIAQAARDTIPSVWILFWSFRVMVAAGLLMLMFFVLATIYTIRDVVQDRRWFLASAVLMLPVPWLACEAGWLVAEVGRQPWTVYEVLPTWMSVSTHNVPYMLFSLAGFLVLYSIFILIELFLMVRAIRQGPSAHGHAAGGAAGESAYAARFESRGV
jgi:cytochrome d ubiquinol oxidase subunit I